MIVERRIIITSSNLSLVSEDFLFNSTFQLSWLIVFSCLVLSMVLWYCSTHYTGKLQALIGSHFYNKFVLSLSLSLSFSLSQATYLHSYYSISSVGLLHIWYSIYYEMTSLTVCISSWPTVMSVYLRIIYIEACRVHCIPSCLYLRCVRCFQTVYC